MSDTAVAEPASELEIEAPKGKAPTHKAKSGRISAALFEDEKSTQDGTIFTARSISLQKSWKKKDGSYDDATIYLDPREVMDVISVLQQSYTAAHRDQNQS